MTQITLGDVLATSLESLKPLPDQVVAHLVTGHEIDMLDGLRDLVGYAEAAQRAGVAIARQRGLSWSEIGAGLGISKQAAQQRYGR